jgi:hypothetical protein
MMALPLEDLPDERLLTVPLFHQKARHRPQRIIPIPVLHTVENELLRDKVDKSHDATP